MQSVLHRIRKFAIGAPVLTGISFLALFLAVYLAGVKIPNALFSDMVAKWLQTKNLIETGNAANCRYSESIDPDFNFIPGPSYFYVIKNQKCWNFYPVPFAYLAAPFDRLLPLHGLYLMNFLLLACVVFFAARTMKVLLPDRPSAALFTALSCFLLFPTGIYALDYSEMCAALAVASASVFCLAHVLCGPDPWSKRWLFGAGLSGGLLFGLRPEGLVFSSCMLATVLVTSAIKHTPMLSVPALFKTISSARALGAGLAGFAGLVGGLAPVLISNVVLFGNLLGPRAGLAADLHSGAGVGIRSQLEIAGTLLAGTDGRLYFGLFTSLPFAAFSFLTFFPRFRTENAAPWLALLVGATLSTLLIAFTAPFDGGYSWSPRYLAFPIICYLIVFVGLLFSETPLTKKLVGRVIVGILLVYSVVFVHMGMRVVQRASILNAAFATVLDAMAPDAIVLGNPNVIQALPRARLAGHVFQAETTEKRQRLFHLLLRTESRRVVYITPAFQQEDTSWVPGGWTRKRQEEKVMIRATLFEKSP